MKVLLLPDESLITLAKDLDAEIIQSMQVPRSINQAGRASTLVAVGARNCLPVQPNRLINKAKVFDGIV